MRSAIILITTSFLFFFSCKDEDPIENPDFPGGCDHQQIHVYTSHGLGVIFFEDRDEKRWRFKRME